MVLDSVPVVLYGFNKTALTMKSYGKSSTYKANDMCGAPANGVGFKDPGFIHDVLLTGLKPGVKYYFQFGSAEVCNIPVPWTSRTGLLFSLSYINMYSIFYLHKLLERLRLFFFEILKPFSGKGPE